MKLNTLFKRLFVTKVNRINLFPALYIKKLVLLSKIYLPIQENMSGQSKFSIISINFITFEIV